MAEKPNKTWRRHQAVKLGTTSRNASYVLRDLAVKKKWKILDSPSVINCFSSIMLGEYQILIVDDSDSRMASSVLRQQLFQPTVLMTPTLVIFGEGETNQASKRVHGNFRSISVIEYPITAEKFNSTFDELLSKWSTGVLERCRAIAEQLMQGQHNPALAMAAELAKADTYCPLVYVLLSLFHRAKHDYVGAEKILLKAMNKGMYELTTVLPLIDLYITTGNPRAAIKTIKGALKDFGQPEFLHFDAVTAHLQLNDVEGAMDHMHDLHKCAHYQRYANYYLPRMLYACGMYDDFVRMINQREDRFDLYHQKWKQLSMIDYRKACEKYKIKSNDPKRTGRTGEQDGLERIDFAHVIEDPLFEKWFYLNKGELA